MENGLWVLSLWNPRDFSPSRFGHIDDRPFGGGPGMVMKVQPLQDAIKAAKQANVNQNCQKTDSQVKPWVIYLSPQGKKLDQQALFRLRNKEQLILIAGRYEGIDERLIEQEVDEEYSIGDYVLSGGELPAMVLIDALVRLLPGCLGNSTSAETDSFYGGLLDYPHYTRPENLDGHRVPSVLLSGDHVRIERWRAKAALGRTWRRRPELLEKLSLSTEQQVLLQEFIDEH